MYMPQPSYTLPSDTELSDLERGTCWPCFDRRKNTCPDDTRSVDPVLSDQCLDNEIDQCATLDATALTCNKYGCNLALEVEDLGVTSKTLVAVT